MSTKLIKSNGSMSVSPKWRRLAPKKQSNKNHGDTKIENEVRKRKPLKQKLPIRGRGSRNTDTDRKTSDGPLAKTFRASDFLGIPSQPVGVLLGPVIPTHGVAMISGQKGVGKTFVAMSIAMAVASGRDLFGWECTKPQRVMYMDPELTVSTLQLRLKMIADSLSLDRMPRKLTIWSAAAQYPLPPPNLAKSEQIDVLVEQCSRFDLLIIDSLSALVRGVDMNTAQAYEAIEDLLLRMRHNGTAVLLVQHLGKDASRGPRGTSKQEDLLDASLLLKQSSRLSGKTKITVTCRKMRHHPESVFKPLEIEFGNYDGSFKMNHQFLATSKTDLIIDRFKELETDGRVKRGVLTQISQELGVSPSQVTKAVQVLQRTQRDT